MAKRWYIVNAHSNFEKHVAESIMERAEEAGLDEFVDEAVVPAEQITEMRKGRKIKSERKFFPGYVLVRAEMNDQVYHLIKDTPKVSGFLGNDNKPMPITEREAARVFSHKEEGVEVPKPTVSFEIGEKVRVCDGPFNDFYGYVEGIDIERARLKVAVSIFGRQTPVELEYGQVDKVS